MQMSEIIYNLRVGTSKKVVKLIKGTVIFNFMYYAITESKIKKYVIEEDSFFNELEIETINRCNGSCSFCPVNVNEKQRPYAKMTNELFEKIISELQDKNYSGNLCIYSNNEPFLDERIIDFYNYARKRVPNAFLYIYTKGTLLTLEKFKKIIDSLDKMIIDNYSDAYELSESLKPVYEYCKNNKKLKKKVVFSMRKQNEILTSRGGQSPNKKKGKILKAKYWLPFKQAIIRPDGRLSLCCNDALGVYTMGDLNNSTLYEIWNSEYYRGIRRKMKENGRKELKLCNACDTKA